jgi:hypothetical protein
MADRERRQGGPRGEDRIRGEENRYQDQGKKR